MSADRHLDDVVDEFFGGGDSLPGPDPDRRREEIAEFLARWDDVFIRAAVAMGVALLIAFASRECWDFFVAYLHGYPPLPRRTALALGAICVLICPLTWRGKSR